MPSITFGQLQTLLATAGASNSGNYLEPGASFANAFNEIGPRVYAMGYWKDTVEEQVYLGADGYISLDRDVDSVMFANINDLPQKVFSSFHDMSALGNTTFLPGRYGLVDMNYVAAKRDLPSIQNVDDYSEATPVTSLYLTTDAGVTVTDATISTGSITAKGRTADGVPVNATVTGTTTLILTFPTAVMFIDEIVGTDLPFTIHLRTDAADADTTMAEVFRGYDVVRYRRFRVGGAVDDTYVHVLVKLAWLTVSASTDIVRLGNISAWKHALLGKLAEDNADVERASYHWGACRQLLEDEIGSARGSAIPKINIDLASGAAYPIHNNY
tara:strand:- start:547 stop:1530 length:984 start_codon:yes stop_codon:yes gene_type:complete